MGEDLVVVTPPPTRGGGDTGWGERQKRRSENRAPPKHSRFDLRKIENRTLRARTVNGRVSVAV